VKAQTIKTILGMVVALLTTPMPGQQASAVYRVAQRDGIWWFIAPGGAPQLSIGVDAIRFEGDRVHGTGPSPYEENVSKKFATRQAWMDATVQRLREWGFNTVGAWSGPELNQSGFAYSLILDFAAKSGADWQHGHPVDVYDPRFEATATRIAAAECSKHASDAMLLGYYSDNELRWGPDWRGTENMLQMYLALPSLAPGRTKAVEFLRARYDNDVRKLDAAWEASASSFDEVATGQGVRFTADNDAFLAQVARRYFEVAARAIRMADSNHLYLGARFSGRPPDAVLRAAKVADVISINIYDRHPRTLIEHVYEVTGRPVLITEFAFRADDSGLLNSRGAGPRVPDQKARARAYREYVMELEGLPQALGYHWFKWSDEPKEGRFDGEDSNYGLVNEGDEPYTDFVNAIAAANAESVQAHRRANQAARAAK